MQRRPLDPRGSVGRSVKLLLLVQTRKVRSCCRIVPVILLNIRFCLWFPFGHSRARYRPTWDYSGRIEMIVWSIHALLVSSRSGRLA